MKNQFGLIGGKLGHSFSPQIHKLIGGYDYDLVELKPEDLESFFSKKEFKGLNITIPYKKDVMKYCDELSETAKKIGSINTIIKRDDGTLFGHNTDYYGFVYLLSSAGIEVKDKKVLVLGSGGSSLMAQTAVKDLGAKEVVVISRSGENNYNNLNIHSDADVIINTTPVGMYPNTMVSAVDIAIFPNLSGVCDIVYNPSNTKLILDAKARNIPCSSGLRMLVAQAKAACELFLGESIDDNCIMETVKTIEAQTKDIVLIGMPGCGKTSVGSLLAEKLGRELIDTDELIEKRENRTIPEIFAQKGEKYFREVESDVIFDVSKESKKIISTGGGAVTVLKNHDYLKQNSNIVYIERELSDLPIANRPISQSRPVSEIFKEREGLYNALADIKVKNISVEDTANKIIEELKL